MNINTYKDCLRSLKGADKKFTQLLKEQETARFWKDETQSSRLENDIKDIRQTIEAICNEIILQVHIYEPIVTHYEKGDPFSE